MRSYVQHLLHKYFPALPPLGHSDQNLDLQKFRTLVTSDQRMIQLQMMVWTIPSLRGFQPQWRGYSCSNSCATTVIFQPLLKELKFPIFTHMLTTRLSCCFSLQDCQILYLPELNSCLICFSSLIKVKEILSIQPSHIIHNSSCMISCVIFPGRLSCTSFLY